MRDLRIALGICIVGFVLTVMGLIEALNNSKSWYDWTISGLVLVCVSMLITLRPRRW